MTARLPGRLTGRLPRGLDRGPEPVRRTHLTSTLTAWPISARSI